MLTLVPELSPPGVGDPVDAWVGLLNRLVNVQTESQFGYGRDELVGRTLQLIIPDVARAIPEINERMAHALGLASTSAVTKAAAISCAGCTRRLFQNLVGNAIKYQRAGVPRIHISAAEERGRKWTFSVKDNGLGIDPLYFERMFAMFQRLHEREPLARTGTVWRSVRRSSNDTAAASPSSRRSGGSTFSFALTGNEGRPPELHSAG